MLTLARFDLRSLCSPQLVQVGWRTWVGILLMTGLTTAIALIIDISDGTMDQMEEMWAETAAVNQNYFWSMFFLGWVLYLLNGLVWAGFRGGDTVPLPVHVFS